MNHFPRLKGLFPSRRNRTCDSDGVIVRNEYEEFVARCGGMLERGHLSRDSSLGAAWKLGDDAASLARDRLLESLAPEMPIHIGITRNPQLNAVATKLDIGDAIALYWPLPLTLQGVAAAIWANPRTAPWIGDISRLRSVVDYSSNTPPGFDLYLGILGKASIEPKLFRSGLKIDHVDAIVAAGDERWEAFLATWMAAIDFVWGHELAHVLYGHTEIARADFGVVDLFENAVDDTCPIPSALSCFMEYAADLDAALNIFSVFYGSMLEEEGGTASAARIMVGACTVLGIVIAMYVLRQGAELAGKGDILSRTHPPSGHRTLWILGAESAAQEEIERRRGTRPGGNKIGAVREGAIALLRSVTQTHHTLDTWIMPLNEEGEDRTNHYLASLHKAASPYFEMLHRHQLVRANH